MTLYTVVSDDVRPPCRLDRLTEVCACVIDAFGPTLGRAVVDGYTDCRTLPPRAAAALGRLETIAAARRPAARARRWRKRRPDYSGVVLDLSRADEREIFVDFAPYSIEAQIERASDGSRFLDLDDSGSACIVDLVGDEHDRFLAACVAAGLGDVRLVQ